VLAPGAALAQGHGALNGKTAVVTGGTRGIGKATVECLRAQGAHVTVIDLDGDEGDADPDLVLADVTDREAVMEALAAAAGSGGLDICVGNAGMFEYRSLLDASEEHWRKVIELNLFGLVNTFTAAARLMVAASRGGRLVATASVAGLRGGAGAAAYCASKAAVISICESLALELAPHGITVNAVAPGNVDTGLHARLMAEVATYKGKTAAQTRADFLEQRVPLRRMAAPREIAEVIAFLAGSGAAYITGETVRVDGGELLI
jgi:NAD(P)-dependent dehydrogenase (short-subunit alcohol dehydrogenase family)